MKHLLAICGALLCFSGCTHPAPSMSVYTILPKAHALSDTPPQTTKTLRLLPVRSVPSLASREIYYLRSNGAVAPYLYSRWSDTPSAMIGRSLTHSLQERHAFAALLSPSSAAIADWDLESDLNAFYHRFNDDGTSEGVFDLSVRAIDLHTKKVLASKRFTYRIQAASDDAQGGVGALEEALTRYNNDCAVWIETLIKETP